MVSRVLRFIIAAATALRAPHLHLVRDHSCPGRDRGRNREPGIQHRSAFLQRDILAAVLLTCWDYRILFSIKTEQCLQKFRGVSFFLSLLFCFVFFNFESVGFGIGGGLHPQSKGRQCWLKPSRLIEKNVDG